MVMLSYCAGLRACEIASLRIGDVMGSDGEAKHTILLERWQTKGAQRQQAVVSEKLRKGNYPVRTRAQSKSTCGCPATSQPKRWGFQQPDNPAGVSPAL